MSITGSSETRKRQRRPSWKMEEMSTRVTKSRRIDRQSHPDIWNLHDLGESDDEEPYIDSASRLKILVRLRIKAPTTSILHKDLSHRFKTHRAVPVRIRLRVSPEQPHHKENAFILHLADAQQRVPVRVRLKESAVTKRLRTGSKPSNLPSDVLLKIFSHLQAVPDLCMIAQVCTQWAEVATLPDLWRSVKATDVVTRRLKVEESKANYHHICYDSPFKEAANTKQKRTARKLCGVRQAVEVITRRGNDRLVSLDLEDCFPLHDKDAFQMRNADLEKIAIRCGTSLEELRISPSPQISGQALAAFAQSCPKLKILHMRGCRSLSSSQFGEIVRACPSLEDISVRQCQIFRGSRLEDRLHPVRGTLKRLDISDTLITRFPISKFANKYPLLEEIKADNCEYMHILDHAPNPAEIQGSLFPSLISVNIDKIAHLPLPWLTAICRNCPALQILAANKVQQPNSLIGDMFRGPLPRLQHLSLAGQPVDDESWQLIFDKLRGSLIQCDLSRNISLTCLLYAEDGQTFEVLEELNVGSTGVTDWTVHEVMRLAPKLTFLDISGCRSVENRDLRRNPLVFRPC